MNSFTIELVSNTSGELFPGNTLSSFTNFLPEQLNLEGLWEVAISEISYPSMYQKITEGKLKFFGEKLSKSTSTCNLEPGLYTSITDIVEAMNRLIQDIVRIHSLMIYTDLIEYNNFGDTKAPLLRCFPFFSKLKSGDIITTGQYMNY